MGRVRPSVVVVTALAVVGVLVPPAVADVPYPVPPDDADVEDYAANLRIADGSCAEGDMSDNDIPYDDFCEGAWKLSDWRPTLGSPEFDALVSNNPQELNGVRGTGLNRAWEVSTGRPDVVVAVMDSGIQWETLGGAERSTVRKHFLNRGELPSPDHLDNPDDDRWGGYDVDGDPVDDGDTTTTGEPDGVLNVTDYRGDSRVIAAQAAMTDAEGALTNEAGDLNGNGVLDPEDLIRIFSDGVDDDGNGYVDDISGWDFFENDNNPQDDTDYGHGTGQARGSNGEATRTGANEMGTCSNCAHLPMRVGDSFVADVNHFAEAVVYAVDNGVQVIQEALGTLNHTSFGQAAIDYAYHNGVLINASQADEAAAHHNWPAAYDHTMLFNSITPGVASPAPPNSYTQLNGCTNFGGYSYVSIPSSRCSSEAVGKGAGYTALAYSAAMNAMETGHLTGYLDDAGTERDFPLSAEELKQLYRVAADDIDFSTPGLSHPFRGEVPYESAGVPTGILNNYVSNNPGTRRYQSVAGWDYFHGYGRLNVARLLRYIGAEDLDGPDIEYVPTGPYGVGEDPDELTAQDRIPPEADLPYPRFWHQYGYTEDGELLLPDDPADPGAIVVHGRAAANRVTAEEGGSFGWVLEYAPHVQGPQFEQYQLNGPADGADERSGGPWTTISTSSDHPDCDLPDIDELAQCDEAVTGEIGRVDVMDLADALAGQRNPFTAATDPTSQHLPEQHAIRLRLRVIANPVNGADTVNNQAVHQKQIDVYPATESVVRDDLGVRKAGDTGGIGDHDVINTDGLGRYAGGAGSPSTHDLDGDGVDELLLPTSDGVIHAFTDMVTGEELPGWPVSTTAYRGITDRLTGDGSTPVDNAFTRGDVTSRVNEAVLAGTLAVADLDDDGTLEVSIGDLGGDLHVWEHDGTPREGFPVSSDPALSRELPCNAPGAAPACDDYEDGPPKRDEFNARDAGFNSAPAVGDLDPTTPGLELVVGSNDTHVYAFHEDGSPVAGWPVILRDPTTVASMDPVTRFYCYDTGEPETSDCAGRDNGDGGVDPAIGSKVLVSPSLGDLDGDGDLEVVIGVNEEYVEDPNTDPLSDPVLDALNATGATGPGNTRVYALHHTGAATAGDGDSDASPHTQDQAYVDGWPVKAALLVTNLLPYVGAGTNAQAVLLDADDDAADVEVAIASAAGPAYLFDGTGEGLLPSSGDGDGTYQSTGKGTASTVTDTPAFVGVGSMAAGSMDGGLSTSVIAPGAGLGRLLDILLPSQQLNAQDTLQVWNAESGQYEDNAPFTVNDLQFFTPPIVADVSGDGRAEALQATAVSDLVGVSDPLGDHALDATALRLFTGGWTVSAATVGTAPGAGGGEADLVNVTREGYLRFWPTTVAEGAPTCTALSQWPEYGHDARNTGNLTVDAERPGPLDPLTATRDERRVTLSWTSSGDDRDCGTASRYELRRVRGDRASSGWNEATPVAGGLPDPAAAGTDQSVTVSGVPSGRATYLLRAFDDQDNGSAVAAVTVTVPGVGGDGGDGGGGSPSQPPTGPTPPTVPSDPVGELVARADTDLIRTVTGDPVAFDGTDSRAGDDARYRWDFGDGAAAVGPEVTHAFDEPGVARVTLTVTEDGRTSRDTIDVQVVDIMRRSGATRIETAVDISSSTFPASDVALVATAVDYADALAGAPLAAADDAPILLTDPGVLPDVVDDELDRLGSTRVIVLGGPDAVAEDVLDRLRADGREVERVAGDTRFTTAVAIARRLGDGSQAFLVEGNDPDPTRGWPDALGVAPLAAHLGRPVLLTDTATLPEATAAAVADLGLTSITVVGGPVAIDESVLDEVRARGATVERVAGGDRYATSALVAERGLRSGLQEASVHLATGRAFPDALAGGPAAAAERAVLLLVDPTSLDDATATRDVLAARVDALRRIRVLGGPDAIGETVVRELRDLIITPR